MINNEKLHLIFIPKYKSNIIQDYFSLDKNQKSCLNYYPLNNSSIIISMFGLLFDILNNSKNNLNLKNTIESLYSNNYINQFINLDDNLDIKDEINSYYYFYIYDENTRKLYNSKIKIIFRYSQYEDTFYKRYFNMYEPFHGVDNYFTNINDIKFGFNSFAVLELETKNDKVFKFISINNTLSKDKTNYDNISKGEKIISVNSNLSGYSFNHFSSSVSYGSISNIISDDTLILDVRILPNSALSNIYKALNNKIIALTLPLLNTKGTYMPIVIAIKIDSLIQSLNKKIEYYNNYKKGLNSHKVSGALETKDSLKKFDINTNYNINLIYNKLIEESVFIVHFQNQTYGTCFHIGNGYFISNKHIFEKCFDNYKKDNSATNFYKFKKHDFYITNNYFSDYKILVDVLFLSPNDLDIAILYISFDNFNKNNSNNYTKENNIIFYNTSNLKNSINQQVLIEKLKNLNFLKINSNKKIKVLDKIYSISYNYFPINDILSLNLSSFSSGEINKILKNNNVDLIYQISTTNYSGASGCPIIDSKDNSLVGLMYENISFGQNSDNIEIGNCCFCIAKETLIDIIAEVNKSSYSYLNSIFYFDESMSKLNLLNNELLKIECFSLKNKHIVNKLVNFSKF